MNMYHHQPHLSSFSLLLCHCRSRQPNANLLYLPPPTSNFECPFPAPNVPAFDFLRSAWDRSPSLPHPPTRTAAFPAPSPFSSTGILLHPITPFLTKPMYHHNTTSLLSPTQALCVFGPLLILRRHSHSPFLLVDSYLYGHIQPLFLLCISSSLA